MNTKSNIASDAAINSFAAGYKAADATLNGLSAVAQGATAVATTTKDSTCGFFSGMRYAIAERRGTKKLPQVSDDAAKQRAREELYRRAHPQPVSTPTVIILSHEGAK